MFNLSSNFLIDRSKAVLLLCILSVICVSRVSVILSCLFLAAFLSPVGKGMTAWLSFLWCFLVFSQLFHMVSWVRCGIWLYRFLIFAFVTGYREIWHIKSTSMRYMKRCYRENISFNLYSTFGHCIYFGLHCFDIIRLMDSVKVLYFSHNLLILDDNNNNGNNNNKNAYI